MKINLCLTGALGHGKSVVVSKILPLLEYFLDKKINLIMMGSLLAKEVRSESEIGLKIKKYFDKTIIPAEYTLEVLNKYLKNFDINLLEGIPRTPDQLDWDLFYSKKDHMTFIVVFNQINWSIINKRLKDRKVCKLCGFPFIKNCIKCDNKLLWESRFNPVNSFKRFREESKFFNHEFFKNNSNVVFVNNDGNIDRTVSKITALFIYQVKRTISKHRSL